jgi:lipopolysaccharide/colanic/teichoic acid biosynthesis glycosyltransferase
MILRSWDKLPENMKNEAVLPYYQALRKHTLGLLLKRVFDVVVAAVLLVLLSPVFVVISAVIALDSRGGVFFRQVRVTSYGRQFKILKFRTMVSNAERLGTLVTSGGDSRVTRAGGFLRAVRLDELPQLINVLLGDMSFVGTRPEVPRYTDRYTEEMLATLLLPAGITSEASIMYKDEERLLEGVDKADIDRVYVEEILPEKMRYNLRSVLRFSFWRDIATMVKTALAVCGVKFKDMYQ